MSTNEYTPSLEDIISFDDEDAQVVDPNKGIFDDDAPTSPADDTDDESSTVTPNSDNDDPLEPDVASGSTIEDEDEDEDEYEDNEEISSEALSAYYEHLKNNELLRVDDSFEFDGTPEKLEEAFEVTKQTLRQEAINYVWNSLPENFKPLLEYALEGGTDLDAIKTSIKEDQLYKTLDLSKLENQKAVIIKYYKEKGFSDSKIQRDLERYEDLGLLEEEAIEADEYLKKTAESKKQQLIEQAKIKKQQEQQLIEKSRQQLLEASKSVQENPIRQQKIIQGLLQPLKIDNNTQDTLYNYTLSLIENNPVHIAQLMDILLDYDSQNGFTFERFKKKAQSEGVRSFKQSLRAVTDTKTSLKGLPGKRSKKQTNLDIFLNQDNSRY